MTRETILEAFRQGGCHAYQAELAADFLDEDSLPHHLLITPAGLGKVLIASRIVKTMVEQRQASRVLVIAPSAFCMLWKSRLDEQALSVPVKLVYGRDLAELGGPGAFGAMPEIMIVPCDTALRADFRAALAAGPWDMAILAEVHSHARCQPMGLYGLMLAAGTVKRSLLISAGPVELRSPCGRSVLPALQVTNWMGELLDWNGKRLKLPSIKWRTVEYRRSEEEVHFLQLLQEQREQAIATNSPFRFETELLVRRAASSPRSVWRTLEIMGRKLGRTSLDNLKAETEKQYGDPTEVEDVPNLSFSPTIRRLYLDFVRQAVEASREIKADRKLSCLLGLLDELANGRPGRICVLSAYADTVTYLHQALSEIGMRSVTINGGLRYAQRQQRMKDFIRGGGILLATPGALGEESDLSRVRHVVHYDLPASQPLMAQIEGRFGRINRTHACRMYGLEDLSAAISGSMAVSQLVSSGSPAKSGV